MKRILALDGGGIRGVFTLEVLLRMQTLLREHYENPAMMLSDHFDFFAGTSTGAIIATCLCWGMDVQDILNMYVDYGKKMFTHVSWRHPLRRLFIARFEAAPLSDMLKKLFSEDGEGRILSTIGTERLKKLLLVVVRNHSTGSQWPLTNNPLAKYNDRSRPDCNLDVPLWKVLRASTAAPVYFDPEKIELGGRTEIFVDGSITPYNNPALIAALTAILPCYRLEWPAGAENIRIVSIGTMRFSSALAKNIGTLWLGYNAAKIPPALIQGIAWEQDYVCRCLGKCLYGETLDEEIGTMMDTALPSAPWFSYVRYNESFNAAKAEALLQTHPELAQLDAVTAIPALRERGLAYANEHVQLDHLI
ncbi:MAG: patatin-like phospholipase family protein [Acidobacteriaceae bacterium]|jgi:patatin-like phospholipase/acyl hydrolase